MSWLRKLALVIWVVPALVLYNNCDGFSIQSESSLSLGRTCEPPVQESLKVMNFSQDEDCQVFADISCDARVFSPNTQDGEDTLSLCFESQAFGARCLDVKHLFFDTSRALGEPEDFAPGGAYNYAEFNCYNRRLLHQDRAIFHSSADTLEKAIDALYAKCHRGVEL